MRDFPSHLPEHVNRAIAEDPIRFLRGRGMERIVGHLRFEHTGLTETQLNDLCAALTRKLEPNPDKPGIRVEGIAEAQFSLTGPEALLDRLQHAVSHPMLGQMNQARHRLGSGLMRGLNGYAEASGYAIPTDMNVPGR